MKRRIFITSLAAPALLAQQPAPVAVDAPPTDPFSSFKFGVADDAGETVLRFFDQRQFATLHRLSDVLLPKIGANPGATEARVPEFIDFLLSHAPAARQQLWQVGLDSLEYQTQTSLRKPFAQTSNTEADRMLSPLRQTWTYTPATPLVEFLRAAKADVRTATLNSREYAQGQRNPTVGQFWKAVE
jgi:hypothetical protein